MSLLGKEDLYFNNFNLGCWERVVWENNEGLKENLLFISIYIYVFLFLYFFSLYCLFLFWFCVLGRRNDRFVEFFYCDYWYNLRYNEGMIF